MPPSRSRMRRRPGGRSPRGQFLIFGEGLVTERAYLSALRSELRAANMEYTRVPGNPYNIVSRACAISSREVAPNDQVWCIFDVESPTPHPRIREALELAAKNNIQCAVSNPCFELWLYLHRKDGNSFATTSDMEQRLCGIFPAYAKKKTIGYSLIKDQFDEAKRRARVLERLHSNPIDPISCNPTTNVWKLVDSLREFYDHA
ncbi:RloB family protein [Actinocatenispora sera]|uniref:RloB family protein n=1 Tax=Actinocatenispora sera TaxID=390989 RepID=UPI0033CF9AD5